MADDAPMDIVFVSPHPDDLEICCGGSIAVLAKQGYRVGMLHTTLGEPTPNGTDEGRRLEAARAAEVLGATAMEILPLQNRELMDCPANRYVVGTALRRLRPKIVVTLAARTPLASPDHWQGELLAEASVFYSRLTKWDDRFDGTPPHGVGKLVYRQIPIGLRMVNYPTSFVLDISETIDLKLEAVACYESQFNPARLAMLQHWIRSTSGAEGGVSGVAYGEMYCLPRPHVIEDMPALFR